MTGQDGRAHEVAGLLMAALAKLGVPASVDVAVGTQYEIRATAPLAAAEVFAAWAEKHSGVEPANKPQSEEDWLGTAALVAQRLHVALRAMGLDACAAGKVDGLRQLVVYMLATADSAEKLAALVEESG